MARSLYKPRIPFHPELINLSKNLRAFYRGDDYRRRRIYRMYIPRGNSIILPAHLKFWILLHTGRKLLPIFVSRDRFGYYLGQFNRTKKTGRSIHVDNVLSKKKQKLIDQLRMEARRRKNKKKPKIRVTTLKDRARKAARKKVAASVETQVVKKFSKRK